MAEGLVSGCHDCGRPYGEQGFEDFLVPHDVWRRISPTGDEGGLLCACCIVARLSAADIRCVGAFVSGPVETVSPHLMGALLKAEAMWAERDSDGSPKGGDGEAGSVEDDSAGRRHRP
jgi:hypothetical protein